MVTLLLAETVNYVIQHFDSNDGSDCSVEFDEKEFPFKSIYIEHYKKHNFFMRYMSNRMKSSTLESLSVDAKQTYSHFKSVDSIKEGVGFFKLLLEIHKNVFIFLENTQEGDCLIIWSSFSPILVFSFHSDELKNALKSTGFFTALQDAKLEMFDSREVLINLRKHFNFRPNKVRDFQIECQFFHPEDTQLSTWMQAVKDILSDSAWQEVQEIENQIKSGNNSFDTVIKRAIHEMICSIYVEYIAKYVNPANTAKIYASLLKNRLAGIEKEISSPKSMDGDNNLNGYNFIDIQAMIDQQSQSEPL